MVGGAKPSGALDLVHFGEHVYRSFFDATKISNFSVESASDIAILKLPRVGSSCLRLPHRAAHALSWETKIYTWQNDIDPKTRKG